MVHVKVFESARSAEFILKPAEVEKCNNNNENNLIF